MSSDVHQKINALEFLLDFCKEPELIDEDHPRYKGKMLVTNNNFPPDIEGYFLRVVDHEENSLDYLMTNIHRTNNILKTLGLEVESCTEDRSENFGVTVHKYLRIAKKSKKTLLIEKIDQLEKTK